MPPLSQLVRPLIAGVGCFALLSYCREIGTEVPPWVLGIHWDEGPFSPDGVDRALEGHDESEKQIAKVHIAKSSSYHCSARVYAAAGIENQAVRDRLLAIATKACSSWTMFEEGTSRMSPPARDVFLQEHAQDRGLSLCVRRRHANAIGDGRMREAALSTIVDEKGQVPDCTTRDSD
ncbi:MAG: hypothetical protein HYT76_03610 [Deltaproteobacteria bacterium]|nr:hypothetical protein [Deltaproteobacteria bacterium]